MILADKIIRLRKKNGWSQEELANKMSVSRQAVSKWEGAQTIPDLEKILQLSVLFGVTPMEISLICFVFISSNRDAVMCSTTYRFRPSLLIGDTYGTHDKMQPFLASLRLKSALEEHGVDYKYFEAEHSGHGLQNDSKVSIAWMKAIEEYLDKYMGS